MVSQTRPHASHSMSPSRSRNTSSPSSPKPRFAETLVTGISRPVSNEEHWALWYFETHALKCIKCHDPYHVQKSGRQLCSEGRGLAHHLSQFLVQDKDGEVRSVSEQSERVANDPDVRVEVPANFEQSRSLLRALARATRHHQRFLSLERSHSVKARPVREPVIHHHTKPETSPRGYRTVTAEPIVDWPRHESRHEEVEDPIIVPSKRGSLYEAEMKARREKERREEALPYKLELREPSKTVRGRHHRHSVFWG